MHPSSRAVKKLPKKRLDAKAKPVDTEHNEYTENTEKGCNVITFFSVLSVFSVDSVSTEVDFVFMRIKNGAIGSVELLCYCLCRDQFANFRHLVFEVMNTRFTLDEFRIDQQLLMQWNICRDALHDHF